LQVPIENNFKLGLDNGVSCDVVGDIGAVMTAWWWGGNRSLAILLLLRVLVAVVAVGA
jgi:hypothetical protein